MYNDGRGVTKDESIAAKWWEAASKQGHAAAQYNLGILAFSLIQCVYSG